MPLPACRLILLSAFAVAVALPPAVRAADMPLRKSGLWEIKTETRAGGQKMPGPMTMQMCIEQGKDDLTVDPKDGREMKKRCSKMDVQRRGNTFVIDSVCAHEGRTVTSHMTISGNMSTAYRMESTSRFTPPMEGISTMDSTMSGKWLGACKPGQTHGSVTLSGMPGRGADGAFKMDPEMMKRMQQMQQQYSR
ncbi:MAG: DUF3617 family protein [Thiobacillus sp.]|nr:DUF3617 family protein [Thiobacillus sp.]